LLVMLLKPLLLLRAPLGCDGENEEARVNLHATGARAVISSSIFRSFVSSSGLRVACLPHAALKTSLPLAWFATWGQRRSHEEQLLQLLKSSI
jgi:hypothetical protein